MKTLAESGALRQFKHNDDSPGLVIAYDKEVTDRCIARLVSEELTDEQLYKIWEDANLCDLQVDTSVFILRRFISAINAARGES